MRFELGPLPDDPLSAAAAFHAGALPEILALIAEGAVVLTLVFPADDSLHLGWREAAVASLARQAAPARVNAVAGGDAAAVAAAEAFLREAPGVTGQYLPLAELPFDLFPLGGQPGDALLGSAK
jgi:hypothetical protein